VNAVTLNTAIWAAQFLGAAYGLLARNQDFPERMKQFTAAGAVTGLAESVFDGYWAAAGFCAGTLALLACDWWKRKGRRVARELGAKSLARLAAVVEKAREAGTLLPEGAGA
jgi:hypothetical protein